MSTHLTSCHGGFLSHHAYQLKITPAPILLGAGKQAEQLLDLFAWMGLTVNDLRVFDDNLGARPGNHRVQGTLQAGIDLAIASMTQTFVAFGSKAAPIRLAVYRKLMAAKVPLPAVVHPSSPVSPSAKLGAGVTIFAGCVVAARTSIGAGATLMNGVTLEHDVVIGDGCFVGPGATVSGFVQIGAHCFLGSGSVVTREVKLEQCCLVGAGATVITSAPAESILLGVPATVTAKVRPGMDAPTRAAIEAPVSV